MNEFQKTTKKKTFRTTINGYYIHDVRKLAKYAFEDFLLFVQYNPINHCYDIFVRETLSGNGSSVELDREELAKFQRHHPRSLNVVVLSQQRADLLIN